MHIHINPVGGIAGDMFISAVLDLRPDLRDSCIDALACFKEYSQRDQRCAKAYPMFENQKNAD